MGDGYDTYENSALLSLQTENICADALVSVSHHLQENLDMGCEGRLVLLDFSAAFDKVNYAWLLYVQCILMNPLVLSGHTQRVWWKEEWLNLSCFWCTAGKCVLGTLLVALYTIDMFDLVGNKLFSFASGSKFFYSDGTLLWCNIYFGTPSSPTHHFTWINPLFNE